MNEPTRVRFAPSPTGLLHIGGLRTALYNYLFTKHHGGAFILRIEDTDQGRYVEEAEQDILDALKWTGLQWDEGPGTNTACGPYRQSERTELYQKYAEQLIRDGYAYYAFDSKEELEQMPERFNQPDGSAPKYDSVTRRSMRNSLTLPDDEVKRLLDAGDNVVVRLKVPENESVNFKDRIRGAVTFESERLDDQVLLKSDGLPTYHLANVVDDHEMGITHVIRGEEWLSSAPKHVLLYQYLGWEIPEMAHLPLIMSPGGGKLSKRKAEEEGIPVNVRDYYRLDFEPEALINFLAFLGWGPGDEREVLSLEEMVEAFTLDRVSKSGAVFSYEKLMWYNEHYMREKPGDELLPRVKKFAEQKGYEASHSYLEKVIDLMRERASRAPEIIENGNYLFEAPQSYDEKTAKKAWKTQTPELVRKYLDEIRGIEDGEFKADNLKGKLTEVIEAEGVGFGKLMLPVRVSVTGVGHGPDLFATMELLGKQEVEKRIESALSEFAQA